MTHPSITNIFKDSPENDKVVFAIENDDKLYTMNSDAVLSVWHVQHDGSLEKTITITIGDDFYPEYSQFINNDTLILASDYNEVVVINLTDNSFVFQEDDNDFNCFCFAKDRLYKQSHLSCVDGYNLSILPTADDINPSSTNVIPIDNMRDNASQGVLVKDTIYWINQDSIVVMDITNPDKPTIKSRKEIVNLVKSNAILLKNDKMIVLESYDNARIGLNYFDISNADVKRVGKGLLKKHLIKAYSLKDETLALLHMDLKNINGERKFKTYFTKVDVSNEPSIISTQELPLIEVYGENDTRVYWMGVNDKSIKILLGNGDLHEVQTA